MEVRKNSMCNSASQANLVCLAYPLNSRNRVGNRCVGHVTLPEVRVGYKKCVYVASYYISSHLDFIINYKELF